MNKFLGIALMFAVVTGSCADDSELSAVRSDSQDPIVVTFVNQANENIGKATLTQQDDGVLFEVEVFGLTPGEHGFHVHEHALCEGPDFSSAGGHFNPRRSEHGFLNEKGPHAGDLPNLIVDANGKARASFTTNRLTLTKGKRNSVFQNGGASLVIHSGADDYISNPAGNSGDRTACGVIRDHSRETM